MKTMSGNEIVEALEYCANRKGCDDGCPCVIAEAPCVMNNPNALLSLIKHQRAEIEAKNKLLCKAEENINAAKAEARRELAMKLKEEFFDYKTDTTPSYIERIIKEIEENENG